MPARVNVVCRKCGRSKMTPRAVVKGATSIFVEEGQIYRTCNDCLHPDKMTADGLKEIARRRAAGESLRTIGAAVGRSHRWVGVPVKRCGLVPSDEPLGI
jgi:hypothetical protein